jgi:hypothetical protein
MSIASDRTAEILATLPDPVEELPRDPADPGRDTLCIETLKTGRYMSGTLLIAAGLYHRLITPPGALRGSEDDRDYGLGIQKYIGRVGERDEIGLGSDIEEELGKDPRVSAITAAVTETSLPNGDLELEAAISAQSNAGPLQFKVRADKVSARFLGLESTT